MNGEQDMLAQALMQGQGQPQPGQPPQAPPQAGPQGEPPISDAQMQYIIQALMQGGLIQPQPPAQGMPQ